MGIIFGFLAFLFSYRFLLGFSAFLFSYGFLIAPYLLGYFFPEKPICIISVSLIILLFSIIIFVKYLKLLGEGLTNTYQIKKIEPYPIDSLQLIIPFMISILSITLSKNSTTLILLINMYMLFLLFWYHLNNQTLFLIQYSYSLVIKY